MKTPLHPETIMHMLAAVNDAITAHRTGCGWCTPATRRECPLLGLAAAALDLILCCRPIGTTAQAGGRGVR